MIKERMKDELDYDKVMRDRRELGFSDMEKKNATMTAITPKPPVETPLEVNEYDEDDNMTSHYDMSFLKRSISEMNFKTLPDYSEPPMSRIKISRMS